ncbi:MAG: hypothetical protein JRJ09_11110 [Deltaproteobacteria bacterium]|nr:hypothetical protein [Deltaproteobacteria bacterium]MBW2111017.1 hypothetical protein [Deltaproteobacteria bacterium]MBW2353188.1 hypothetical protein [Deltaproteobacteria bacterium]
MGLTTVAQVKWILEKNNLILALRVNSKPKMRSEVICEMIKKFPVHERTIRKFALCVKENPDILAWPDCGVTVRQERGRLIKELKSASASVKQLSGLLPICASCTDLVE